MSLGRVLGQRSRNADEHRSDRSNSNVKSTWIVSHYLRHLLTRRCCLKRCNLSERSVASFSIQVNEISTHLDTLYETVLTYFLLKKSLV